MHSGTDTAEDKQCFFYRARPQIWPVASLISLLSLILLQHYSNVIQLDAGEPHLLSNVIELDAGQSITVTSNFSLVQSSKVFSWNFHGVEN
jgi:hypothetical protein